MRWFMVLAALAACGGCGTGERVPGPTLQVMSESYKPRRGEPLPRVSAVAELAAPTQARGATRTITEIARVRLRGARGETLGLQVALAPPAPSAPGRAGADDDGGDGADAVSIALTFDPDAAGVAVQAFAVDWVEVRRPSTAMYGPSRGPGWYPDRLVPRDGPVVTDALAYFDVAIGAGTAPGVYRGWLSIGGSGAGGARSRRIRVELTVEPVTIDLLAEPLVWVWYNPRTLSEAHGTTIGSPAGLDWERRFAALFRAHGAYLSDFNSRDGFELRADMLRDVQRVPIELDTSSEAALKADVAYWIERFRDLPAVPFAIPVDEPRTPPARARAAQIGRWAHEAGAGPGRFLIAVTAPPDPVFRGAIDVFVSWNAISDSTPGRRAGADGSVGRWTYNGAPGRAGSVIIDTDGVALRTWGWIAERYRVPLWYAWAGMYFTDRFNGRPPKDVLRDPVTFDDGEDHGNGDGLLAYPGALPSLRLKALRRGLQDRLLLRALRACGGAQEADDIVRRMIPRALGDGRPGRPGDWPTDEVAWERARNDIFDAIADRCPAAE